MARYQSSKCILLAVMLLAFVAESSAAPPNIVLIMADDLGWSDLHCQGNDALETPAIDKLASQGMRFTDAYAAAPVCTPTRAAMMTGLAPARLGITNHAPGNPDHVSKTTSLKGAQWTTYLSLEHRTLAERLRDTGYKTGFIGKWHLSHRPGSDQNGKFEPQLRPQHQGFDLNVGGCSKGGPPSYFEPYRIPNITPRRKGDYLPERLADEAIDFVKSTDGKPFFLCWWNYSVHYPIQAPEKLIEKYKQKKGVKRPAYAAMIEGMDTAIGRVLASLDDQKLSGETLVLFTSDNGSLFENLPLRESKGHLYEGGIRVPFMVRWPGHVKPGTLSSEPVVSMDVLPTLLNAAKIDIENERFDGEDLTPVLKQTSGLKRDALYFHYPNYAFHKQNRLGSVIRQGKYKLIDWHDSSPSELYDLENDLAEKTDLSSKMPSLAKDMEKKLGSWLKETDATMPTKVNR